ncbi:glutathione S-transferase [Hoeflea sp. IMCC20628]|uniref:glutathione S-transferase family protein n=1 Tax=Hoeflea sp. IMCC20628 TaxID=1620421 RepID=UPI00063BE260|nr:glutathione S-transferase family protein [Hoeflea sp. IMCC20628]AKH98911.1 glutathione S-transferase [Hoeflea sp. IMCC20628]
MNIALYYAPFSCALVPYVMLTEAEVSFDVRPLNIRGKANMTPEYLALNPKHKVPLLLVDGEPLSENVAIQLWIARSFPHVRLLPTEPWAEAQAVSLLSWFASGIHPGISRYNAPLKFCDVAGTEDSTRRLAGASLLEGFRLAEKMLEGRTYLLDEYSSADIYLFWCFRRSGFFPGLDLSGFENIAAHSERLAERSSIRKALALDDAVKQQFGQEA